MTEGNHPGSRVSGPGIPVLQLQGREDVKKVRLVQTGLDTQGRSTVASDELVDARELPTGRVLNPLWAADAVVTAPSGSGAAGLFPSPGGARFWVFTVRANEPAGVEGGLHRTDTVDLGFVVSGLLTMRLESGTVDLNPGDCYVQNGTLHGWLNPGAADAVVALVVLGVNPPR
jgi:mannose-6-phosphate isomerase-like protein (cupin superfamily)